MLFALRQPATLLGLVLGFAVGCLLRATLQQAVIGGLRSARRAARDPHYWLDPYGVVGALIGGMGWTPKPEVSRFRARQVWLMVVVAVVVHGALTAAGLAGYVAAGGSRLFFPFISTIDVIHGNQLFPSDFAQRVCLGFGIENLACGLLALVPIPPLELGVALWSTLPKSASARRMAYRVLEEQWGVAIILVLMLLPLAGQQPALLALIGSLADRVVHAL
jgi:hypothetical protein